MKFEVGQRVWFVNHQPPSIKLMMVAEEIVKKTLEGESRDYIFRTEHQGKLKDFNSTNLTGDFFNEMEAAYQFMHNQAGEAIRNMLGKAQEKYEIIFGELVAKDNAGPDSVLDSTEDIIVELPDGTKARMKGDILK